MTPNVKLLKTSGSKPIAHEINGRRNEKCYSRARRGNVGRFCRRETYHMLPLKEFKIVECEDLMALKHRNRVKILEKSNVIEFDSTDEAITRNDSLANTNSGVLTEKDLEKIRENSVD